MKPLALVILLVLLGTTLFFAPAQPPSPPPADDFILEKNVAVPMRDGVMLRADTLRPRAGGPFPVLVYRTPYNKEDALKDDTTFGHAVERGYAVVVQDVRGRYASAGEYRPYQNEGRDGYDTIEWAALQNWSNGAVGTFGLSYPAAVQWLAAVEDPPHLKAMVPAMTFSTPGNFFYSGGVFDMSWIEWIWNNMAPDARVKKDLPGPRTYEAALSVWKRDHDRLLDTLPLSALPDFRQIAPYYYDWLAHPPDDPWWDWAELRNQYARVHAAVLNLSGWYDEDYGPEGATTNFLGLLKARRGEHDARTHLLIGPWVHGGTELTKAGDRDFGPQAPINYDEVVLRWLDHYVRGLDNGVDREKPVRLFVMGDNRWRQEDAWPPPAARPAAFFLAASPAAGKDGQLVQEAPSARQPFSALSSDPADPVRNPYYGEAGAHDYRQLAKRRDVVVFDSTPLPHDLEVVGPVTMEVYVSCDCRDFDLWVKPMDVAPDGTAFNLAAPGSDVLRASYRDPGRRQLLRPGGVYRLRLENLRMGNVFKKGHRIRAQLSASFFPDFSRNLQTGELETLSAAGRQAAIRIYHDRDHPSRLVLPVVAATP